MDIFDDDFDIFGDLLGDPPAAPGPRFVPRWPREASHHGARQPAGRTVCPQFKFDPRPNSHRIPLHAPDWCMTVAAVVDAFNADSDFTCCDRAPDSQRTLANRTEFWAHGFRDFLVHFHNGKRLMGMAPASRSR